MPTAQGTPLAIPKQQPCYSRAAHGARCRDCQQSEARCAFLAGCCPACTHFGWLDADGQEKKQPRRPACGTEGGYAAHRYYNELPCGRCRDAHCRYNQAAAEVRRGA